MLLSQLHASQTDAAEQFRDMIMQPDFPCVGAKSATARGLLSIVHARDITSAWNDLEIHRDLLDWSEKWRDDPDGLRSLAVVFDGPHDLTEKEFETALWQR